MIVIAIEVLALLGVTLMCNGIIMVWFYAHRSIKQERLGKNREGRHSFGRGIEWALVTTMGFLLLIGACALLVINVYGA